MPLHSSWLPWYAYYVSKNDERRERTMMNHKKRDDESFGGTFVIFTISVIVVTFVILGVDGTVALWNMIIG